MRSKWDFVPPKECNQQDKLFSGRNFGVYNGIRLNKAKLLRKITPKEFQHSLRLSALSIPIPVEFSWRKSGLIEEPREQYSCGSCWAMSVCSSLGDRYSVKYKIPPAYLSPFSLLTKSVDTMEATTLNICDEGGDPYLGSTWLEKSGNYVSAEKCWPYSMLSKNYNIPPNSLPADCCSNCCGEKIKYLTDLKFNVKKGTTRSLAVLDRSGNINIDATTIAIQREIMANGPVVCGMQLYNDFQSYWSSSARNGGIYICSNVSGSHGGHAVTITGWGEAIQDGNKIRYWEMRNSWGRSGDDGYCKIAFSLDAPNNKYIEVEVPVLQEGEWSGGMFCMDPGALPDELLNKTIEQTYPPTTQIVNIPETPIPIVDTTSPTVDTTSPIVDTESVKTNIEEEVKNEINIMDHTWFRVLLGVVVFFIVIGIFLLAYKYIKKLRK